MKGYLATHFFNDAGFMWTQALAGTIRTLTNLDLYVPQENGEINDKSGDDSHITSKAIAEGDSQHLRNADILIASLDGVEIDSGVSAEIGYFSGLIDADVPFAKRPRMIIGLYTDMRREGSGDNHFYINLYTKGLVELNGIVVHSIPNVVKEIRKFELRQNGGII